ncbi:MAG: DUF1015 domain-containing protein [Clostridiales bacterium]|nr:DUF1015 domain-containing protein [Clostridiales bacterium]
MKNYQNGVGVLVPEILLPGAETDFAKWAVVACDQFTSEPEYWTAARGFIGDAPSTLDLFLPEAFLGKPDEGERIAAIRENMRRYYEEDILRKLPQGFVLTQRSCNGLTRHGLVLALDLEAYDYAKGSCTLIRATEGTIEDRIPPRLHIRDGATIELPHILVLIDDPARTVIEPLAAELSELEQLYDTDLMADGGHVAGWLVDDAARIALVLDALAELADPAAFDEKYPGKTPLLFAMGDGNHSFATAKANWIKVKAGLTEVQRAEHPARYALVEIENMHDKGIVFEPIHRVLFHVDAAETLEKIRAGLARQNGAAHILQSDAVPGEGHVLPFVTAETQGAFHIPHPSQQLPVGTLQTALDALLPTIPGAELDYIHGEDVVQKLAAKGDAIGFILPAMEKGALFPTVVYDGALPRKTFSMGEANEKRYYLECRSLI